MSFYGAGRCDGSACVTNYGTGFRLADCLVDMFAINYCYINVLSVQSSMAEPALALSWGPEY